MILLVQLNDATMDPRPAQSRSGCTMGKKKPPTKPCQLCRNHSTGFRRQCSSERCRHQHHEGQPRQVGSGCVPENCWIASCNLCRSCYRELLREVLPGQPMTVLYTVEQFATGLSTLPYGNGSGDAIPIPKCSAAAVAVRAAVAARAAVEFGQRLQFEQRLQCEQRWSSYANPSPSSGSSSGSSGTQQP